MNFNVTSKEKRKSVKKDYNIIAEEYAAEFGKIYEDIEVIEKFLSYLKPNSKILDLGGGTGKLTDLFIQKGYKAICYDFSKEMMRKAQEFYRDIPYILDDMIYMKDHFENNSLDGIIAFYSLFHIPREELDNVFSCIYDLLKENGVVCFVVQLGDGEEFIDKHNFKKIYETEKAEVGENELGKDENSKVFIIARKNKVG